MNNLEKAMRNLRESKKAESDKLAKLVEKKTLKEEKSKYLKVAEDLWDESSEYFENAYDETNSYSEFNKELSNDSTLLDALAEEDITSDREINKVFRELYDMVKEIMDEYDLEDESKIIKESSEIDADQAYTYLYNNFTYEVAKLAWKKLSKEQREFWKDSYKATFEDDEDYPNGYEGEPSEEEVFQYFYDDGNLDPESVLEDLSEKDTIEIAKKVGIDKYNQELKDKELSREEAIKKLMGTSGLSREEVLEIVNQIK